MADTPPLRFGIEIEAYLAPKEPKEFMPKGSKLEGPLEYEFVKILADGYVPEKPGDPGMCSGYQEEPSNYDMWVIKSDPSLDFSEKYKKFPAELISPILTLDGNGNWQRQIKDVFTYIEKKCDITTNNSCGFHVHMSPGDGEDWTVDELRRICFAAFYFDKAIRAHLPRQYRDNEYAQSNIVGNPKFNVHFGPDELNDESGEQFMVAWNLRHLITRGYQGGKSSTGKTIEWRQPPAVKDVEQCFKWTTLALSFVQAARGWENIGNEIKSKYSPDTDGLRAFVNERGGLPGTTMKPVVRPSK